MKSLKRSKNRAIFISEEAYGTLLLIQNRVLGPYTRLMSEKDAAKIVNGRFEGEPMPYAYTFAPEGKRNQEVIQTAKKGEKIDLVMNGDTVGHLVVSEIYPIKNPQNSIFLARGVAVGEQRSAGEFGVSGEFEIYDDDLAPYREMVEQNIREAGARKITVLTLTADPFNRMHERLVRMTIDKADLTIVFLIRTFGSDGRLSFALRLRMLRYFRDNFIAGNRLIIVPFEHTYLFSDHINPVLECIAAKNFGATKLVVGQNHAGIGMYFDGNQANTVLDKYSSDLGLEIIVMPELVYCDVCRTIVSTKTCPHGSYHHIKYHAHTIKELLFNGLMPPAILMRKEISAMILDELFPARFADLQRLYDDLFPNQGIIEKHTQAEFYKRLGELYQTTSLN